MEEALRKMSVKTIEAKVVQSAENEEPQIADQEPTKPVKLPEVGVTPPEAKDWSSVDFSHKNPKTTSPLYDKTVGDIYDTGSLDFAQKMDALLQKSFVEPMDAAMHKYEMGETGAPHPKDVAIWEAITEGRKRLAERIQQPAQAEG